jgi:hypothetical protein
MTLFPTRTTDSGKILPAGISATPEHKLGPLVMSETIALFVPPFPITRSRSPFTDSSWMAPGDVIYVTGESQGYYEVMAVIDVNHSCDEESHELKARFGIPTWKGFNEQAYAVEMGNAKANGIKIRNMAYVQNQNYATHLPIKHERYLALAKYMMSTNVAGRLQAARTCADAFRVLQSYPLRGKSSIPMHHLTDLTTARSSASTKTISSFPDQVLWMEF